MSPKLQEVERNEWSARYIFFISLAHELLTWRANSSAQPPSSLPGGSGRIQIRFEMFNACNHPSFSAVNSGLVWNIAADFSDYSAHQEYSNQWVRNTRTGVNPPSNPKLGQALGEANNLYPSGSRRVIQLAAKVYF